MRQPTAPLPTEMQRMTYRALLDHIELCTSCGEGRPCETGVWLRQAQQAAERRVS